ncbi:MAG TPA: ribonuclease HII [Candidatus Babeliales bacterium]|nr:ribonuclease HII [Candidatus Babeliales bacterium]
MIGVDEVGRGCLAGPLLVVAARALTTLPDEIKDSKLLSRKQRRQILNKLSVCCEFGEGWVNVSEIDKFGLARALKLGTRRSLLDLRVQIDEEIIMDGNVNYLPKKFKRAQVLIGADNQVPIVSAASIHAKVTRDNFMIKLAKKYPIYNFEQHVGYGTPGHQAALTSYGFIRLVHRRSFAPVSTIAENL